MTKPYEIGIYRTDTGKEPYTEWEESLEDSKETSTSHRNIGKTIF